MALTIISIPRKVLEQILELFENTKKINTGMSNSQNEFAQDKRLQICLISCRALGTAVSPVSVSIL